MGGRRRRMERRNSLTEGGWGALSGLEAGRSVKQGYLLLYVTGMYSSSVPWSWDPHLLDLVWSLDVLLHEGTLTWAVTQAMLCEGWRHSQQGQMPESPHANKMPESSILPESCFSAFFGKALGTWAAAAQWLLCSISKQRISVASPDCTYLRGNEVQFWVDSWALLGTGVATVIHSGLPPLLKYLLLR